MNKTETKLKVAAEEIKEILRKYDIAGAVSLHSPGHGEHFLHLNPSYSCASIVSDKEIRFYSKLKDYKSKEEQMQKQEDTVNMCHILSHITGINFMILEGCSRKLDDKTGAEHY
jgi:hypothetical protein